MSVFHRPSTQDIESDFDDGTLQGWSPEPPFNGELFVAPPGNPGQSMQATDTLPSGGQLFARAPATYSGDLTRYLGISWDEYILDYGSPTVVATSVIIEGPDGTLWETDDTLGPTETWRQRFASFQPEDWFPKEGSASFEEVVQNVVALFVQMDVTALDNGILECRVDNVILWESPTPTREITWGAIKVAYH